VNAPAWYLEGFENNKHQLLRVALTTFPFSVGRTTDCDLPLNSLRISQVHAEFFSKDNDLWLRDRHSTNGTFVNGQRIESEQVLHPGDIVHFADLEFRLDERQLGSQENMFAETLPITKDDLQSGKYREFRDMLASRKLQVVFQPLVNLQNASLLGYESLGRGLLDGHSILAQDLFAMAETLGIPAELSRLLREQGASTATLFANELPIFVNTHPAELNDFESLIASLQQLRENFPLRHIVLEIHESAVTDLEKLQLLRIRLKELNMGIAFDDFGVGQARLIELSDAAPHYLKFDESLIRNIHRASKQRRDLVKTLVHLALSMNIIPIAEGIEKQQEAEICQELGFIYGQGFHLGRPVPVEELVESVV